MRIGIIGLGSIAKKAYLPVMANRDDVEPVLCTRNTDTLYKISSMYRISERVQTVDELIKSGVRAAFVHAATEAHVEIVEKLLSNGIDVYVDKPAAYTYDEVLKLTELSEKKGRLLMVGFNRRFSPMYSMLKEKSRPDIILMEKNRTYNPGEIRQFIFDDFIHVVDTLRFLLPGDIESMSVNSKFEGDKLLGVVLQLCGGGCTAIGIMNRDCGVTEETVEYMSHGNKWVVRNLNESIHFSDGEEKHQGFNDWDPVLYRRGFYQITDHFLNCVCNGIKPSPDIRDSLITHEVCEKIVNMLETKMNGLSGMKL